MSKTFNLLFHKNIYSEFENQPQCSVEFEDSVTTDGDFVIISMNNENVLLNMENSCYQKFISNLKQEGLLLRIIKDDEFIFTIVTINKKTLQRYAEILKLRLPIKEVSSEMKPVIPLII